MLLCSVHGGMRAAGVVTMLLCSVDGEPTGGDYNETRGDWSRGAAPTGCCGKTTGGTVTAKQWYMSCRCCPILLIDGMAALE